MPIGTARIAQETTLAALAENLFYLEHASAAVRRQVERALLELNPELQHAQGFKPGLRILVPHVAHIKVRPRIAARTAEVSGLLNEAASQLKMGARRLSLAMRDAEDRAKQEQKQLSEPKLLAQVRRELPDGLPTVSESVKNIVPRMEQERERGKLILAACSAALRDVERLEKQAGGK